MRATKRRATQRDLSGSIVVIARASRVSVAPPRWSSRDAEQAWTPGGMLKGLVGLDARRDQQSASQR
jgi:hypothetical protein